MKPIYLDFEYNSSCERHLNLVCASWKAGSNVRSIWLHNDRTAQRKLADYLESRKDTHRIVCFGGLAEGRSLSALGLNPLEFKWADLWVLWKQMRNCRDRWKYGTYFRLGEKRKSVPPNKNPKLNRGKDCMELGFGLVDAVAAILGVDVKVSVKDSMRNLILENKAAYSTGEKSKILRYCESDIVYLRPLFKAMVEDLISATRQPMARILEIAEELSEDVVSMSLCESEGYPVDWPRLNNLTRNTELVKSEAVEDCVAQHPFYVKNKHGDWVEKYAALAGFIENLPVAKTWPKTDSGRYSVDEKTLDHYSGIPEIYALKRCKKTLGQLKWFRDENWDSFCDRVGSDYHVRAYLNPYGTQTGRNAPPSKIFIPAMSSWLRALIRPEPGWAITAIDWEAQEFGIAAALSSDHNMKLAYRSKDPYTWFAKRVKAIPENGDKHSHPTERQLFKATVLGLQYLMGDQGLAAKLSSDMGKVFTEEDAAKLSGYHKKIFSRYWTWLDEQYYRYEREGLLSLQNGWSLFADNPNHRSIKNSRVQGCGAVMMRRAVRYAQKRGIRVPFPLHDALYIYHPEESSEEINITIECMDQACAELLGDGLLLRTETNTYTHEKLYIEKKGEKEYERFRKYLEKDFTEQPVASAPEAVENQTRLTLGE